MRPRIQSQTAMGAFHNRNAQYPGHLASEQTNTRRHQPPPLHSSSAQKGRKTSPDWLLFTAPSEPAEAHHRRHFGVFEIPLLLLVLLLLFRLPFGVLLLALSSSFVVLFDAGGEGGRPARAKTVSEDDGRKGGGGGCTR